MSAIRGIHHITAFVADVNEAIHFYEKVLELRLVKQTVDFEAGSSYHIYFANQTVSSGTIFTFFPWQTNEMGQKGAGQVGRIAFKIGKGHLDYWKKQLQAHHVQVREGCTFGAGSIDFSDGHGIDLSLVASEEPQESPAIYAYYGAELLSAKPKESLDFLEEKLGFKASGERANHWLLQVSQSEHLLYFPKVAANPGTWGVGTVHHIAFLLPDEESLGQLRQGLVEAGYEATVVRDRKYFKSVYLREVGGVILEFATEGPGFTIDESDEELGTNLMLPQQFEKRRQDILDSLPEIKRH